MKTLSYIVLSIVFVICSGCGGLEKNITNGCIEPIAKFSYPVNLYPALIDTEKNTAPQFPWKGVIAMPDFGIHQNLEVFDRLLFSRVNTDQEPELFIMRDVHDKETTVSEQLLIFNTKKKAFSQIEFSGHKINVISYLGRSKTNVDLLLGYSSGKNEVFQIENDHEVRLLSPGISLPRGEYKYNPTDDLIYIFVPYDGIYTFDWEGNEINQIYSNAELSSLPSEDSIGITANGLIVILTYGNTDYDPRRLLFFDPNENEIIKTKTINLKNSHDATTLYIDKLGNTWLNDLGWLDQEDIWHQIIRSGVFVSNKEPDSGLQYIWPPARLMLISSDNTLWFDSPNGVVRVDPASGEWCWVTTFRSNIIEDDNKHLWLVMNNQIYSTQIK